MAFSPFPTSEPPQAMILRRLSCFFNPMKKDNFSDAYLHPIRHAGN